MRINNLAENPDFQPTIADKSDIPGIILLNQENLYKEGLDKKEGYVSIKLTEKLLAALVSEKLAIVIKENESDNIIAYYLLLNKDLCKKLNIGASFNDFLDKALIKDFDGRKINKYNRGYALQICITKEYRGLGILDKLSDYINEKHKERFDILISGIDIENHKSMISNYLKNLNMSYIDTINIDETIRALVVINLKNKYRFISKDIDLFLQTILDGKN